ncbi:hypothetical protein K9L27_01710 [Candidatus Gracilibacteria bacterium]|nr:hypothetical protein [Candidatus Gracilibacteria bacterium]
MKRILYLCIFFSFLLTGCENADIAFWEKEIRNTPARVAIDTIEKLVRAQSLFRNTDTQYQLDLEDFKTMFHENEYEILVEDHRFFYCYDLPSGEEKSGNFVVLAVDMNQDVFGKGTSRFRERISDLRELPEAQKNADGFANTLNLFQGTCLPLPTAAPETGKFSRLYVPIENLPSLTPEEVAEIEQRVKRRLEQQIRDETNQLKEVTAVQQDIRDSESASVRIKLR